MDTVIVYSYPYERILVWILATTLAVFLVLAIIISVKVIKLLNHAEKIATKAEEVVDKVEELGENIRKTVGSFAVSNLVSRVTDALSTKRKKRSGGDEE